MAPVSQVDAVYDALSALVEATLTGWTVYDGNDVPTSERAKRWVVIGGDGDPTGNPATRPAATTRQDPDTFDATTRTERGLITLALGASSGDSGRQALAPLRSRTLDAVTDLEAALRAADSLGVPGVTGGITTVATFQHRSPAGSAVRRVMAFEFEAYQ